MTEELIPVYVYKNLISYEKYLPFNNNFLGIFYVINTQSSPYPAFADLFCVFNKNSQTIKITYIYDPYDIDIKCSLRIMTWLEPTPFSTPIYIYKEKNSLFFSLTETEKEKYDIQILHFLNEKKKFSQFFGRCLPDKSGESLKNCSQDYKRFGGKYPNIISYLEGGQVKKTKNNITIILFVLIVLILFFVFFFFYIFGHLKRRLYK